MTVIIGAVRGPRSSKLVLASVQCEKASTVPITGSVRVVGMTDDGVVMHSHTLTKMRQEKLLVYHEVVLQVGMTRKCVRVTLRKTPPNGRATRGPHAI
jgi:hypothetical protein